MFKACRALSVVVLLWGGSFSLASAAVFNVNTLADVVDIDTADGVCMTATAACSLRAAIQQANASAGADVIELASGVVYNFALADGVLGDKDDKALMGDLDVRSEITINGHQAVIDAMKLSRVFQVHSGGNLVLNKVTVRNGLVEFGEGFGGAGIDVLSGGQLTVNDSNITLNYAFVMGGGISNFNGSVTLNRSVINQNRADGQGAGVYNIDGNLTINDTEIRNNGVTSFLGGGIFNAAMGYLLEINNSTISGHSVAVDGGGIYHLLGNLKITNSTISGNTASRNGGGLFLHNGNSSFGGVTHELRNVTIANNRANGVDSGDPANGQGGAGLYVEGKVSLETSNTIIADSTSKTNCYFKSADSELISLGYNLDTDGSCQLSADASSFSSAEAGLAPLANNGGVTKTHALLASSEALDTGGDCLPFDQRGYTRPLSGCDIGAYESGAVAPLNGFFAPLANQDTSTGVNSAPVALNQSLSVNAGDVVIGVLRASDIDGDSLTFQTVLQPQQGDVGRGAETGVPGEFEFFYKADVDATGSDTFTFHACDSQACSEPATISITIGSEPVSGEMVIELAPESTGVVSPLSVAAPSNLDATVADLDYSMPFGVFYFDVEGIPTAANLEAGTEVVIQLPADAIISADAVIRKLDVTGTWQILPSEPSPVESRGVIDPIEKTLTLTLRDNDRFDTNPELGVIRDPVAIAVLKSTHPDVQDLQASVAMDVPPNNAGDSESVVVDDEPVIEDEAPVVVDEQPQTETTAKVSSDDSGGSGTVNPLLLACFGLLMLVRRRAC